MEIGPKPWQQIDVYVSDDDRLMCYEPNCPMEGEPWLPGRRVTLGTVVKAFVQHVKECHTPSEQK